MLWIALPVIGQCAGLVGSVSAVDPELSTTQVPSRSVAVTRSDTTPDYVHSLAQESDFYGMDAFRDVRWLQLGLESRTRYENRSFDYTTPKLVSDGALVTRNLLYLGITDILDPLRMAVELEDSRRFISSRAPNPRIENHGEVLQAYVQLYFKDVFEKSPFSITLGRMTLDAIDRRLVERTRNRNSMTAFDGIRLRLGDEKSPWEIDTFALRHVEFDVNELDQSHPESVLYGLTFYFRNLAEYFQIEPYWLWLDQRRESDPTLRKNLHTFGTHLFGQWGEQKAWDYDVSLASQLGEVRGLTHRAAAIHLEAGYTWTAPWKPRAALWFNYATGDRNPKDTTDERFDSIYGDNFSFYSYCGYFTWQNIINPAVQLRAQPTKNLRFEIIHRGIWLASSHDAWVGGVRRDPSGRSGSYVGQETDARIVWRINERMDLDVAYGHLFPGNFIQQTGVAPGSNFVQAAVTIRF